MFWELAKTYEPFPRPSFLSNESQRLKILQTYENNLFEAANRSVKFVFKVRQKRDGMRNPVYFA